jgi:hypothetical protein
VVKASARFEPHGYVLRVDPKGRQRSKLLLTVRRPTLGITLFVESEALAARRAVLVDRRIDFVGDLHTRSSRRSRGSVRR